MIDNHQEPQCSGQAVTLDENYPLQARHILDRLWTAGLTGYVHPTHLAILSASVGQ